MKKTKLFSAVLFGALALSSSLFAQVKIGDNPSAINNNAVLDVESATKGILFPRVSLTATTNPSPLAVHVAGMQVYNISTTGDVDPGVYYNDGGKWIRVGGEPEKVYYYGSGAPSGSCTTGTMYVDTLEGSSTEGKTWVCTSGSWTDYIPPASTSTTPFYLGNSTSDAKGNKGSAIYRTGNVGLNVANPKARLHISGNLVMTAANQSTGGIGNGTHPVGGILGVGNGINNYMAIQSSNSANLYLAKRANFTAPNFILFTVGGSNVGSISRTATGVSYATGSDIRLKENIKATHFGVEDLMKIEVKDYNYISNKNTPTTGFIAQQLYKVFPAAVTVGGQDVKKDPWTVDYGKVTPLLVKAIQDQQAEIVALKAQLAEKDAFSKQEVAALRDLIKGQSSPVIQSR